MRIDTAYEFRPQLDPPGDMLVVAHVRRRSWEEYQNDPPLGSAWASQLLGDGTVQSVRLEFTSRTLTDAERRACVEHAEAEQSAQ